MSTEYLPKATIERRVVKFRQGSGDYMEKGKVGKSLAIYTYMKCTYMTYTYLYKLGEAPNLKFSLIEFFLLQDVKNAGC